MERGKKGNGRKGIIMVKGHTHLEKGNGKETVILENINMGKKMDKEHIHFLMEESMKGNLRMGN